MSDNLQWLDEILDNWLVHDESCPTSWSGVGNDKCDCIAKNQAKNIRSAIATKLEHEDN